LAVKHHSFKIAGFDILVCMKRSIAVIAAILTVSSASAVLAAEGYKTAQNQLIVKGLKPGKLYGVIAATNNNGYGVKNFTANACGEVIIEKAAGFKSILIDRKKILVKSLATKAAAPCTKVLPAPKPAKPVAKPQR
jgi:hypothetical protein